jgi:hypothetical protein
MIWSEADKVAEDLRKDTEKIRVFSKKLVPRFLSQHSYDFNHKFFSRSNNRIHPRPCGAENVPTAGISVG